MAGRGTAMSVRTRLALFTAFLVALMLAIGTIAVIGDQAASDRVRLQSGSLTPTLQANAELQSQLRRAESSVANYLLLRHALAGASGTPDDVAQVLRPARDALRDMPAQLSGIDHFLSMPPFDDAELVGDLTDRANSQRASMSAWRQWALDVVERNAQRLRGLIEDLLVLNRLEATVAKDGGVEICAGDLIREVCEELMPVAARGQVRLIVGEGACGSATWLRGDRAQLGRALTNIVSNRVKFTPPGGTVTLASRPVDEGRSVEISCVDTGMGIPEADQARLFTRFFRAGNATQAQVPGTGLGLSIVQGIVERHGGNLELESTENVGTTLRMTFATVPAPAGVGV